MTSQFVERMTRHFGSRPCPKGLKESWHQLEQAVSTAAEKCQWQVIQWPTGSGKTEALTVLCAMPEIARHPGALIVTKFTEEADEVARKINAVAGSAIAVAAHKKAPTSAQTMNEAAVLIITHEAYRASLREACDRPDAPARLDLHHRYFQTTRKWIIIDEAFNWIDVYDVDLDDACAMCAALLVQLADITALHQLSALVEALVNSRDATRTDALLSDEHLAMLAAIDFVQLRNAIKALPSETIELWRNATLHLRADDATPPDTNSRPTTFKSEYVKLLARLDAIRRIGRCWISQRGPRTRLHSSRLLLDTNRPCGVILDATASLDRTYEMLASRVALMARPANIRSYRNVTAHVSRPHHVGKQYLAKHAATEWPTLIKQLSAKMPNQRHLLIVTQKATREKIRPYGLSCGTQMGHWGELDGKNEWRHCDTVLIYGLPYPDDIAPTDTFHACTEKWSNEWFAGERQYGAHADVKSAIKCGVIARNVVQAINRVHCRTIIDDQGNCAPTDVFILLPRGTVGDVVLTAIEAEMPGARVVPWTALPKKSSSLTRNEQKLLLELQPAVRGIYTKTQMIERLSITSRTFERMSVKLQTPHSVLMQTLAALGVEYRCTIGRGKEACFIKH